MAHGKQAVVIGGGIAGLLNGRILADHFEQVTVVERDALPEGAELRKGIPQARHIHILLARGQVILERLFPGLGDSLVAAGATRLDLMADTVFVGARGRLPRFPSPIQVRMCSRELLEWNIRCRVAALPNVRIMAEREVTGLLADSARSRVAGVRLSPRPGSADGPAELEADLVVDASGRSSRAVGYLEELGYERPRETVVNSFLGYSSRWYHLPEERRPDWKAVLITARPPRQPRGGGAFLLENNRWLLTLAGTARDYPPTEESAFRAFMASLPDPLLNETFGDAEPLSPIAGYRRTENRLRHFEELRRWPEGFVVAGDAVCGFNPVYGQGMTAAALGALALEETLRRQATPAGLAAAFQRRLARANRDVWLMATSEDFRWPTTEGARPGPLTRLVQRYMNGVLDLTAEQPGAALTFTEVTHLLKPPSALFHPRLIAGVIGLSFSRKKSG
jgi:2-polyprenyl-6-methoxyphenol hydroxylase-like FAD-dependent oxidoreductase